MKKFIVRSILFIIPILTVIGIELFILPVDFFTFRVWEALVVRKYRKNLLGPFYPNMEITKIEEGDLAHHTRFAVKKKVKWITDRYGYRKGNTDDIPKVVIVGDSNIAGSGSTQKEILSEILEDQLKVSVYPLAPNRMETFLKNKRFLDHPPEVVILAGVERELIYFSEMRSKKEDRKENRMIQSLKTVREFPPLQFLLIFFDRLNKANMLHYFRASLRRAISSVKEGGPQYVIPKYGAIYFLQGESANKDVSEETLDKTVQIIKIYSDAVKSRGIRFIFLPIPEKENIFCELLRTRKPTFLERLISELRREGVETIDTQKAFEQAFHKNGVLLYHTDDTHWNANAVKITAELIAKILQEKE